jgi:hypothetical protein
MLSYELQELMAQPAANAQFRTGEYGLIFLQNGLARLPPSGLGKYQ